MLTIFSCPKPFKNHINTIQRNAIRSWTLLKPKPEIILFGNENGVKNICKELRLKHIPKVKCSKYGTPLVDDMFRQAQQKAENDILSFVNADIILMNDFMEALNIVMRNKKKFLLVGRRNSLDIKEQLDFREGWEKSIRKHITNKNLSPPWAIDYFVFTKNFFEKIPPLIIGRPSWDNWVIYDSRSKKKPIINVSRVVQVVHQRHDYSHLLKKGGNIQDSPESLINHKIVGEYKSAFTINDSIYILTKKGLKRNFYINFEREIGRMGILLKKYSPKLYLKLKKLKDRE